METQSNFGALIQTDAETSKFTKSFSCPHIGLSRLYLDESNLIQFTYLRGQWDGESCNLETASLFASLLSYVECKSISLYPQAHPEMEWVEILWLGIQ